MNRGPSDIPEQASLFFGERPGVLKEEEGWTDLWEEKNILSSGLLWIISCPESESEYLQVMATCLFFLHPNLNVINHLAKAMVPWTTCIVVPPKLGVGIHHELLLGPRTSLFLTGVLRISPLWCNDLATLEGFRVHWTMVPKLWVFHRTLALQGPMPPLHPPLTGHHTLGSRIYDISNCHDDDVRI